MTKRSFNMKPRRSVPVFVYSCGVSVLLIVFGIVAIAGWPYLFDHILKSQLVLTPTSPTFDVWKQNPFPLQIDFYFFNWTNPEDINKKNVKPKLEEIGPYSFKEVKQKANITWNQNGTVTYRLKNSWWYLSDQKNQLSDALTTVNPLALTAGYVTRTWSYFIKKGLSLTMKSMAPSVNITRTISQMLFEGYEDPMINTAKSLPFLVGSALPPWDKFGWFYTRNGSTEFDGVFNMGTGEKGTAFGKLYNWNHQPRTTFFPDGCGLLNGSAGELFPPKANKKSISFFSADLCRSMKLDYVGEDVIHGILGYKYVVGPGLLDNGTVLPENKCFCSGECVPSGAVNVSACRYNTPTFASLPHFYKGDPYYTNLVEGLEPEKSKHEFSITLEPTTGIPLAVNARLQVNMLLQSYSNIELFQNVPKVFFPMIWFEQKVRIPEDLAFKLRLLINLPVICSSMGILCVCIGLLLMSCSIYKACTTNLCGKSKVKYPYSEQQIPLNKELKCDRIEKG